MRICGKLSVFAPVRGSNSVIDSSSSPKKEKRQARSSRWAGQTSRLSPRTRNAQVGLYQSGDVDYLVGTDAIGMGLNLDIKHVAFSATAKFDGRRMRGLYPQELAQIAGRAGRHTEDGTFGVTGEARPFDEDVVEAIETHRFAPVRKLHWRNEALDFGSVERLIRSLEEPTGNDWLTRARDADDLLALKALAALPEVRDRLTEPKRVQLLWDVCRIPDFRSAGGVEHTTLLTRIFEFLVGRGLLRQQAQTLGLQDKVQFLGFVERSAMPAVYAQADIFCLPSFNEGMSMALLEAMASGLPVIVTTTGGLEELLDGNGLVAPWADVEALAGALATLAQDDPLRAEYGRRGRQIAERFTWPAIVQQYVQLCQRVLDRQPGRSRHDAH